MAVLIRHCLLRHLNGPGRSSGCQDDSLCRLFFVRRIYPDSRVPSDGHGLVYHQT